jgi:hypothetical protein
MTVGGGPYGQEPETQQSRNQETQSRQTQDGSHEYGIADLAERRGQAKAREGGKIEDRETSAQPNQVNCSRLVINGCAMSAVNIGHEAHEISSGAELLQYRSCRHRPFPDWHHHACLLA